MMKDLWPIKPFVLNLQLKFVIKGFIFQRWEVVAEFINQHSKTQHIKRQAKETLAKAKDLQSGNFAMSTLKGNLSEN